MEQVAEIPDVHKYEKKMTVFRQIESYFDVILKNAKRISFTFLKKS